MTEEQKDFFIKIVPFAQLLQQYTYLKANVGKYKSPSGLFTSLALADILTVSEFGEHKLAKKYNNLLQVPYSDYWYGKPVEYQGVSYRNYDTWLEFVIDYSDEVTFYQQQAFAEVLAAKNLDEQIEKFLPYSTMPDGRIEEIIEQYGLQEFDS
jgi:hypothetical protein